MSYTVEYTPSESRLGDLGVKVYTLVGTLVFLLMMLVGVLLRAAQGTWITLGPDVFYQFMTLHGAGMVGTAGLAATGVLWHFLRRYVRLSSVVLWINLVIFLAGVVCILGAILVGKFGAGWTFLYPLPARSGGLWGATAASSFLIGLLLIGVGFLILYLDIGIAILKRYGSLGNALGLPVALGRKPLDPEHPTTVVAGTMVLIVNVIGIAAGAVVLVMSLLSVFLPQYTLDALLMKNLIFFFGHVFINATIYSAVVAVYELLPRYTGRPWKVSKPFYYSWIAVTLMVMAVYPHHLLMDFAMPRWMLAMGQILSFASGIPVLVVTAFGALTIVYKSGLRWDTTSRLLMLSMFGWAGGVIPAIIDATITVNKVMHNTLWVPGHFHFYLVLGLLPMIMGFAFYIAREKDQVGASAFENLGFWAYFVGGLGLVMTFLAGGANGVPRRWAVHMAEWELFSQLGAIAGVLILVGTLVFFLCLLTRMPRAQLSSA